LLHSLFSIQEEEEWLTDDFILGVLMDLINTCKIFINSPNIYFYYFRGGPNRHALFMCGDKSIATFYVLHVSLTRLGTPNTCNTFTITFFLLAEI
jgi:hypothetical protein